VLVQIAKMIDAKSGVPFYRQIIDQEKVAVACGHFRPDDRLPTAYQLAADLSISANTVIRAYRALEIERMLATKHGSETFVNGRPCRPRHLPALRSPASV